MVSERTYTGAELRQRLADRAVPIRDSITGRLNDSLQQLRLEVIAEPLDDGVVLRVNRDAICDWAAEQVTVAVHEVISAIAAELLADEPSVEPGA